MFSMFQIKVSVLMVPRPGQPTLAFYDEIARSSGGRAHLVTQRAPVRKYWEMVSALRDICGAEVEAVTVHAEIHGVRQQRLQSSGSFLVDSSLGRDTVFGIIVEDEEDHLINSVLFENEAGEVYGPYSHIATTFDTINLKTISFGLSRNQPFGDRRHVGQLWRYTVTWHVPRVPREAVVTVTSRPRVRDPSEPRDEVRVAVWTSEDGGGGAVSGARPLAMFASVTRGGLPVAGAVVEVFVAVTGREAGAATQHLGPLQLLDSGSGDPDTAAGDGVYSRQLVQYPGPGRYVFTAHVSSLDNVTTVMTNSNNNSSSEVAWLAGCCGSAVTTLTGAPLRHGDQFRRVSVPGPALVLAEVPDPELDTIAPARVTDLRAELQQDRLVLTWTAPGGDSDYGRVSATEILVSPRLGQLLVPGAAAAWRQLLVREDAAGARVSHQLQLEPSWGRSFYVGVAGRDAANNTGRVSNLAAVVLPPSGAATNQQLERVSGAADSGPDLTMVILGVCVSLLLLAILLVLAVLYIVRARARPKQCQAPAHSRGRQLDLAREELTDNTSCSSDPRNTSGHSLVPATQAVIPTISRYAAKIFIVCASIKTLVSRSRPSPGPYLFTGGPPLPGPAPDSTPSYWSATKLLTEHEQRALAASYAPLPGGGDHYGGWVERISVKSIPSLSSPCSGVWTTISATPRSTPPSTRPPTSTLTRTTR